MFHKHIECHSCDYQFSCYQGECIHDYVFPLNLYNTGAYLTIIVILGISTVGGLGGGNEKLPILMMLLNYSQQQSTYQTYALMFGANFVNYFILVFQRHPNLNKHLIDYDIVLILMPTVLFGSAIGSLLSRVLSDFTVILLLMLLMIFLIPEMKDKAVQQHKEDDNTNMIEQLYDTENLIKRTYVDNAQYIEYLKEEQSRIPWKRLLLILAVFFIVETAIFMRGSSGTHSWIGIEFCSPIYWGYNALVVVLLLLITYAIKVYLSRQEAQKRELGFFRDEVDYTYTWSNFFKVWASGFSGGLIGGIAGLGSGAVIVPGLIMTGINIRVASATAGVQKLVIASFSILMVYQQQLLSGEEIVFFISLGLLGALGVAAPIYIYVNKSKKNYIILYLITMLLVINLLSGGAYIFMESIIYDRWDHLVAIHSLC